MVTSNHDLLPAAVLWDLDGTLVDTEPLWMAAERELAETYGKEWTDADGLQLVGFDLLDSGAYIRRHLSIDLSPGAIVEFLVKHVAATLHSTAVSWRPGVKPLIEALRAEGIPQAIVTMSYQSIAVPIAEQLPIDALITGDMVTNGKPHPEPYLLAASKLGIAAGRCLAIEDSNTGANSANAAGCLVLAVPNMVAVTEAPNRTHLTSLAGVMPADLRRLF